mgnify:CR=1 FL=1
MFYSFVTLFGVLSQLLNSDPLRYCYLTPKVLRSGGLGKELIVFGINPGDLQTLKVSVPAVALRLCGIRRVALVFALEPTCGLTAHYGF